MAVLITWKTQAQEFREHSTAFSTRSFTTKSNGMEWGCRFCRAIIESHSGQCREARPSSWIGLQIVPAPGRHRNAVSNGHLLPLCVPKILNPNVLTMKSRPVMGAELDAGSLNLARDRRSLFNDRRSNPL